MNVNQERIAKLQEKMQAADMDMYLVPTADFHQSEYVGTYFKVRAWLSGFSGSAGTLLVTRECLLVDRRQILYSGGKTAGRYRGNAHENGRGRSSYSRRIY